MAFPITIKPGFDFEEAIPMAELSQRAYRIFENEAEREPGDVYRVLYRDEWHYQHSIGDLGRGVRCFIARRGSTNQYAIVFRGSTLTSSGIEWTNLSHNNDDVMIPYEHPAGIFDAALNEVRVHRGTWQSYAVLRPKIELFFAVLMGVPLKADVLKKLAEAQPEEQSGHIEAIAAAIGAIHGETAAARVSRRLTAAVRQLASKEKALSDVSLNQLITDSSRLESVLADLADADERRLQPANVRGLEIYICGHSLGGVLAQFCAITLQQFWTAQEDFPRFALKVYTVGSPKTGNRAFVELYNRLLSDHSYRVENQLDPAIRLPQANAPFPYNLQLMIPNVDFVRDGDNYYARYEAAGEAYTLFNVGYQNVELNFGGPLRLTLPIPFPHGPDGYKEMLARAQEWQQRFWKPAQNIVRTMFQEQMDQMVALQMQMADLRMTVESMAAQQESATPAENNGTELAQAINAMQQQIVELKKSIDALHTKGQRSSDEDAA